MEFAEQVLNIDCSNTKAAGKPFPLLNAPTQTTNCIYNIEQDAISGCRLLCHAMHATEIQLLIVNAPVL